MRALSTLTISASILLTNSAYAYDTPQSDNCSAAGGCYYGNNHSGAGGYGVYGQDSASSGGYGVYGYSTAGNSNAVLGYYNGTGSGSGVGAVSGTGGGTALYALANNGRAVDANASGGDAIHGTVDSSYSAVAGINNGSGPGVYAVSSGGTGIDVYAGGWAIYASGGTNALGVYGTASSDNAGGAAYGTYGYGNGTYTYGAYGYGNGAFSTGLYGSCAGSNCIAIYAGGDIGYTGSLIHESDARLKKDIEPLKGSLDQLLQLRGVSFRWREPSKHGDADGIQRGFVAQDYEKIFPEWVKTDRDGYKMIDTSGLDALEVESIRVLKAENDDLKKRLTALENQRHPIGTNTFGWAVAGLAMAAALVVSRRKDSKGTN